MKFSVTTFSILLLFSSLTQSLLAQTRTDRPSFFEDGQEFLDREIQRIELQQQSSPDEQKPSRPLTIERDRKHEGDWERERDAKPNREENNETHRRGDALRR